RRPAGRGPRHRAALTDGVRTAKVLRMKLSPGLTGAGLALTLLASAPSAGYASPLDATRVTLKNGMRVVLAPDSLATAVDVAVWFPAGTRHEKSTQSGLALLAARLGFRNGATDPLA